MQYLFIIFLLFLSKGIFACEGNCINGFGKQNYRGEGWSAVAEGSWKKKGNGESYMFKGKWNYFESGKPTEVWEGNFNENNQAHGKCHLVDYKNGKKIKCEWIEATCPQGILETSDGAVYEGEIKFNEDEKQFQKHGKGSMVYADGTIFKGTWIKNKKNGKGSFTSIDKKEYIQSWKNGELKSEKINVFAGGKKSVCEDGNCTNGKGKKIWANGRIYEGDFKDGLRHGYGINKINGIVYIGEWKEDKLFGQGKYVEPDGTVSEGNWKNNTLHGKGSIKKNCLYTISGEFADGKIVGLANIIFGDCNENYKLGDKFIGNIDGTQKLYKGEIVYKNGNKYIGEVKKQTFMPHGQGEYLWKDQKYVGAFQDGFRHGKGIYTWDSGGSYDGEWKKGNRHGQGVRTYKDGTTDEGKWYENDFVPHLKIKVEKKWKKAVTCYRDNNKGERDPNSFIAKGHMDVLAQNIEMQKQTGNFFSYVDTITDQSNRIIDLLGC